MLSTLHGYLKDLDKIKRLVKTLGFAVSVPNFDDQPFVINRASRVFEEIFGDDGVGTRFALGTNELPGNIPVEIEFLFEI